MRIKRLIALLIVLSMMVIAPAHAQEDQTIVDIAVGNEDFSTLVTAVQAAGLADVLSNPDASFTVFAPTNAAFDALPEGVLDMVLADQELLTRILTYHVVDGAVLSSDLSDGMSVPTLETTALDAEPLAGELMITIADGTVMVNDATVVQADIEASNGVIHVIDSVLLPPDVAEMVSGDDMMEESMIEAPAHVRVGHFSPDAGEVDVYINGEAALSGVGFPALSDWMEIDSTQSYEIAVAPAGTSIDDAVIGPVELAFDEGTWVTIAAVGSAESGTLTAQLVFEDYGDLTGEQAQVTVFHAIEGAPAVNVLAGETPIVTSLAFPGDQGNNDGAIVFEVPAGTYDLSVVPAGATEPVLIDLPGTEIEAGMYYFIAAVGTPDSPEAFVSAVSLDDMMMEEDMGDDEMDEMGGQTIVDIAAGNEDFSTLVTAVQTAGLVDVLSNPDASFTVFAPTNAAFEALPEGVLDMVLADQELLTRILTYHVVDGAVLSSDLSDGMSVPTLETTALDAEPLAGELMITIMDGTVMVNDATVVQADIEASNGVIHVIDSVLLPPEVAEMISE
jgi:uncharacterized surface protein with fasciclin (FAS1) repeats